LDNIINGTHGIYGHELLKLSHSVLAGCIPGLEREIRGKSAGFRTLAMICFGATIFTVCSYLLGVEANRDRIAANIITGIGFIGAGGIFRTNSSISGITIAASTWSSRRHRNVVRYRGIPAGWDLVSFCLNFIVCIGFYPILDR
jgi:putative Mg2+ transporter-C (MgtC) family protein